MEQPDGRIMTIYCHWDGYLDNNGRILVKHYRDRARVLALMLLGDLSQLGQEIGQSQDFDAPANRNWCVAYGRDRGETGTEARVYADMQDYLTNTPFEEYNYIFRLDDAWYVDFDSGDGDFTTVEAALKRVVDTNEL
jgi:hypothetical protein